MDDVVGDWPRRRRMPELTSLDAPTQAVVAAAVDRLRDSVDEWTARFLRLVREHVPGYDQLADDDIRGSARTLVEGEISELESMRIPDDALREQLEAFALKRVAQGISIDTLSLSYHLGSREMLALMDEIAVEVAMPTDLLLAIHDSTWEFANEAAAVFARVQHGLLVEQARFDAERRSAFARGVLSGTASSEQIQRDAALFGLDARRPYVAVAARATTPARAEELRRLLAVATRTPPDRLLVADVDGSWGCISPSAPEGVGEALVAIGPPLRLEELDRGFDEAVEALETAERFGMAGAVRLTDLGPRPLVLPESRAADLLAERHLGALAAEGRMGDELRETVRVYLECDQRAADAARLLTVHANTVRYRVNRFRELTGLDLRRTEDIVTTWWLLNRGA
ncbi:PucR family transcriptional regulator [Glaciibacter flavus]|uniref:PucR family transcriptional regulator n=1 Tax=Orlajensenia flava TaxID=2565934 RepID=A0A4S4FV92_9MICO|nr:PucR family transcriptional regulator [Glaciibacter flavus]THG34414.1 PucR family transcriptional regulator [Glaciibacter flavus]